MIKFLAMILLVLVAGCQVQYSPEQLATLQQPTLNFLASEVNSAMLTAIAPDNTFSTRIPSSSGTPHVIQLVPVGTTDTPLSITTPSPTFLPEPNLTPAGGFVAVSGNISSNSPTVIVRNFPSESGINIGILLSGKEITIQARNLFGDWLFIYYSHDGGIVEGWINRVLVENNGDLTTLPFLIGKDRYQPANIVYDIDSAGIILRKSPKTNGSLIKVARNTEVNLLFWTISKDFQYWYFVRLDDGTEGWMWTERLNNAEAKDELFNNQPPIPYLNIIQ